MKDIVSKMLDDRLFDPAVADRVRALMTEGKPLDAALLEASGLPEDKVLRYLAAEFQVPYVDLEQLPPAKEFLAKFPARILLKHRLLPMEAPGGEVWAVTSRLFGTTGVD